MELPNKKYKVIYADPPWQYDNVATGGTMKSGASQKYPTMPLEDILSLPVKEIADKNSVLFLWATVPFLHNAFHVLESWGFRYKTMLTWRKIMSQGLGFWFSGQTEHLLFGIRGKIPAFHSHKANIIQYPTWHLAHSEKPAKFRGLITEVTKGLEPKIELFTRQKIEGWDCWGNQTPVSKQRLLKPQKSSLQILLPVKLLAKIEGGH